MIAHMKACRFDMWEPLLNKEGEDFSLHVLGWSVWENPRYFIMCYDGCLTAVDKRDGTHAYQGESLEALGYALGIEGNSWGQVYCE